MELTRPSLVNSNRGGRGAIRFNGGRGDLISSYEDHPTDEDENRGDIDYE